MPFSNFGSVSAGRQLAQIGGFEYVYDTAAPLGERVQSITLEDGRPVVVDGQIVYGPDTISVATIDFLLRGGDGRSGALVPVGGCRGSW